MVFLLVFLHVAFLLSAFGSDADLQCRHNYEEMFCKIEVKNCSGHQVSIQSDGGYGNVSCILQQLEDQVCSCGMNLSWIVIGDKHSVTLSDKEKILELKTIRVFDSFQPKTPEIISVNETDGNFGVSWKTNMEKYSAGIPLTAQITYYKKGEPEKEWKDINPSTVDGFQYYAINGENLEMDTIYVVKVRSVASMLNNEVSDNSKEWEFKTPASNVDVLLVVVIVTSIASVFIIIATCYSLGKLKTKWWDNLPNPTISIIRPIKELKLQPEKQGLSPVYIEPAIPDESKHWSELSDLDCKSSECESSSKDSSIISYSEAPVNISAEINYNLSKLFPNIVSQLVVASKEDEMLTDSLITHKSKCKGSTSGSSDLINRSYSLLIPKPSDDDLSDRSDHMNISTPVVENLCQKIHTDPERGFFKGVSPISSDNVSCASSMFLQVPRPMFPPAELNCPIEVVDDYQFIQNQTTQTDVCFQVESGSDHVAHLEQNQDAHLGKMASSCLNPFLPNNLQTSFHFLTTSNNCILDNDYHKV